MRLLIISCSATKRPEPTPIPAIERYDGPLWRVLRSFQREQPIIAADINVWAISAEHGLIPASTPICLYDRRMSTERAKALHSAVLSELQSVLGTEYTQICLAVGKDYLRALCGWEALLPQGVTVTITDGTAGVKQGQLRAWLEGRQWYPTERLTEGLRASETPRGTATVAGVTLRMTREEVLACARAALANGVAGAHRYRDWCVLIDGQPVAPKWLVSVLTGQPTSAFQAGAARQALLALGIDVAWASGVSLQQSESPTP